MEPPVPTCTHPEAELEWHTCPFAVEVWRDESFRCTCCEECTDHCQAQV